MIFKENAGNSRKVKDINRIEESPRQKIKPRLREAPHAGLGVAAAVAQPRGVLFSVCVVLFVLFVYICVICCVFVLVLSSRAGQRGRGCKG